MEEEKKTMAGHAPATKVAGGMRVAQHKRHSESEKTKDEKEEVGPNDETKVKVSGAVADEVKDFPAEAIKAFHDKPQPSKQPHANPPPQTHHNINQPRK